MRLIILFCLLVTQSASARWAKLEDASFLRLSDRIEVEVDTDGTYVLKREFEDEIKKEPARIESGIFQITYNSRVSDLRVLKAATLHKGKTYPVAPEFIQDKPLASSYQGFDQIHQIMVAFPNVEIGARVRLALEERTRRAPIPGVFSRTVTFGDQRYDVRKEVRFRSRLPLVYKANDPEKLLEVREGREGEFHILELRLKRPFYRRVVDEQRISVDTKNYLWVDVASTGDWGEMFRPLVPEYEKILKAPLPDAWKKIADRARLEPNPVAQFNFVTAALAASMHYLGDWRAVNGGHVPRALAEVARTKFGDCKDFTAATVAILRSLGHEANPAFIFRGVNPELSPTPLANVNAFNHAIVWARADGKEYWIDPTNQNSFAQGVMEDIIDRPALVLAPEKPFLSRTPAGKPEDALAAFEVDLRIERDERLTAKGLARYTGRATLPFTGAELNTSRESLDFQLISNVGDTARMEKWSVGNYDLKSRIATDFRFDYSFSERDAEFRTTAGPALPIASTWIAQVLLVKTEGRVSDLYLEQPIEFRRDIRVRQIAALGEGDLSCTIASPWVEMKREYAKTEDGIRVRDDVKVKRSRVTAQELGSAEFAQLQREIRRCYEGAAVIFKHTR